MGLLMENLSNVMLVETLLEFLLINLADWYFGTSAKMTNLKKDDSNEIIKLF